MRTYIDARTGKERTITDDRSVKAELKNGSPTCQCSLCGLYFTGWAVFDKHLIAGGVKCRTPEQMREIGMITNEHGVWQRGISAKQAKEGAA